MSATQMPHPANLDLRRLRTLDSVARHRSFSKAAAELHFTQSAVSQQIATLERDLGARLVHRNPVSLTDAGAALCRRYESVVAELAAGWAEVDAFRDGGSGRVRIAASTGSTAGLLPRAVAAVSGRQQGVDVWVSALAPTAGLAALRRGEIDLAVAHRFDAAGAAPSRLQESQLLRDRLTLAVPRGHRLAAADAVTLSDLGEEKWIHVPDLEVPQQLLLDALGGNPYRPLAVLASGGSHAAQGLVGAGVGVALVPELDHRHDVDVVHLPIADASVGRSIFAVALTTDTDGVVHQMLQALVASARRIWPQLLADRAQTAARDLRLSSPAR